ncbi:MAG: DUF115 domain-containing protein [Termitinemataceae bacterium]|nr:MAG: DUF115 domain-containing protein [Termitinemataceae bacterium]
MNDNTEQILVSPARSGFSLQYRGKTLLSTYNPIKQSERAVEAAFPLKNRTLYLCPSPLFGYGLGLLLKNLPPDSAVICAEADKALSHWTARSFDKSLLNTENSLGNTHRLQLVYAENPLVICDFVQKTFGKRAFRRVITIKLNSGWQIQEQIYTEMEKMLTKNIAIEWSNAMTLSKLGRLYARNAVRNLPLLATSKNAADINLSGRNVLVLGAGPSLDDLFDHLMPGICGCYIICVDTALGGLLERGIKPDLVVALEAQHWNLRDFIGAHPIPIAMDLSALPATADFCGSGGCQSPYLFWTQWTEMRFFEKLAATGLLPIELPAAGSVGLSAVALALKLNAKKVLCAGLDFSFTVDKYHCKGSPSYRANLQNTNRFKPPIPFAAAFRLAAFSCTAKDGSQVRSDPSMKNYRDLFSLCFSNAKNLFDIKNSGLPLGIKSISYNEAIEIVLENTSVKKITSDTDTLKKQNLSVNEKKIAAAQFIQNEITNLNALLRILQGKKNTGTTLLENLIDETDYLWAHFPDCAGAGGQHPPVTDITFLKRVRVEIAPFLKLFDRAAFFI